MPAQGAPPSACAHGECSCLAEMCQLCPPLACGIILTALLMTIPTSLCVSDSCQGIQPQVSPRLALSRCNGLVPAARCRSTYLWHALRHHSWLQAELQAAGEPLSEAQIAEAMEMRSSHWQHLGQILAAQQLHQQQLQPVTALAMPRLPSAARAGSLIEV